MEKMRDKEELLSKSALIIIGSVSIIILTIGLILLTLGYNEAFYIKDKNVQIVFNVITFLGEPISFIIIIATLYIVYDKRFAKNLAFSLLISGYLNEFLKNIFRDPRPPTNIDPSEEYGLIETSYGFPSGHTQLAVTVWGYLAFEFRNKSKHHIIPIILLILIFLISISRVILGVHDLEDIIGGYIIGICFLIVFIYLEPIISPKINQLNLLVKIIISTTISISLFAIAALLFPTSGLGLVKNAPAYTDTGLFGQVCGAMLGLSIGYLLENEYVKYEPSKIQNKQKILNFFIGIIILMITYFGLDILISGHVILRFIRYALVAFILTFIVPLIFIKINRE